VPGAARAVFAPINWQAKQTIKAEFAAGTEYFLCTGGIHPRKNLINLLKAFSLFKKWQHSNMKLVIAGRLAWEYEGILEKLQTYKYREDVVMTGYLPDEQLAKLTAGAYALVYPSWFEGFGLPVIEAMQAGTPVITSNTSSMPEAGGEAALYANPAEPDSIAKHMLSLYRDETFRSQLIEAGFNQAAKYNWDVSAEKIWNVLKSMMRK
jgi:glycosyltransferase involved in cell wall biosynthesis